MHIQLTESITLAIQTSDPAAQRYVSHWLAGWPEAPPTKAPASATMTLNLQVGSLPSAPPYPPFFVDTRFEQGQQFGNLSVYAQPEGLLLWFARGGRVQLGAQAPFTADFLATPEMVASGRFEDMLLVTLAYFLRRHHLYFVHAFGVQQGQTGYLILGGSGSGKTTTGLNSLIGGGRLIANDAPLLAERGGQIVGLPAPGLITIRPGTFGLLPELADWLGLTAVPTHPIALPSDRVAWATAVPIRHLFFVRLADSPTSWLAPLPRALALAYVLEESVDQWDSPTSPAHLSLLERLVQQATPYTLHLGRDTTQLRQLLLTMDVFHLS